MKPKLLALLVAIFPLGSQAFVKPMKFDEKCREADAILQITVEKVEEIDLTEGLEWQFHGLARCKVISSFKGSVDWKGKFIFIPCDYLFDESPSPIKAGNEYIVFLETMGNFSKFGHPIGPYCCHGVAGGKVSSDIPGKKLIKVAEFAQLINAELEKQFINANAGRERSKPANPQEGEQGGVGQPAAAQKSKPEGKEKLKPESEGRSQ